MVTMDLEKFKQLLENNEIKFTPAQKKIVNKITEGYKIVIVNQHRQNGGEWYWSNDEGNSIEYAGKVYKAFWNIFYTVRNQLSIEIDMNFAIVQNNNIRYN